MAVNASDLNGTPIVLEDSTSIQPHLVWYVFDAIIGSLGILGNGLVMYVFVRTIPFKNLVNLFIVNQSMIDFTTSVVFIISHLGPIISLTPGKRLHTIICKLWVSEYILWSLFISSSINLMNITLERYFAIMKPQKYRNAVGTVRKRIIPFAVLTWLLGFILDWPWAGVHKIIPPGLCFPIWRTPVAQAFVGVMTFFVTYLLPLSLMVFTYVQIISELHRAGERIETNVAINTVSHNEANDRARANDANTGSSSHQQSGQSAARSKANRNIIKTMASVSTVYAICWAPAAFNYLVYNLGVHVDFTSTWFWITKVFVYINMCANPFIYTMQYRQFQEGLKKICGLSPKAMIPLQVNSGSNDTSRRTLTTDTRRNNVSRGELQSSYN